MTAPPPKQIKPFFDENTAFTRIPRKWMIFIEPKIHRSSTFGRCWYWTGALDRHGKPILAGMINPATGRKCNTRAMRFAASIFFALDTKTDVYSECRHPHCMNPRHWKFRRNGRLK